MMHMPSTAEQLNNTDYHDAIGELKSLGKVRYGGLSHHGPQWNGVPVQGLLALAHETLSL